MKRIAAILGVILVMAINLIATSETSQSGLEHSIYMYPRAGSEVICTISIDHELVICGEESNYFVVNLQKSGIDSVYEYGYLQKTLIFSDIGSTSSSNASELVGRVEVSTVGHWEVRHAAPVWKTQEKKEIIKVLAPGDIVHVMEVEGEFIFIVFYDTDGYDYYGWLEIKNCIW